METKQGIEVLGALRRSEHWGEGAQTEALMRHFDSKSQDAGQGNGTNGRCKIDACLSNYSFENTNIRFAQVRGAPGTGQMQGARQPLSTEFSCFRSLQCGFGHIAKNE